MTKKNTSRRCLGTTVDPQKKLEISSFRRSKKRTFELTKQAMRKRSKNVQLVTKQIGDWYEVDDEEYSIVDGRQ